MAPPLDGISVLDFSTLLPGPLASLMLAETGATVIKIERPGGEDMRHFAPLMGENSAPFMALNAGKHSLALDLKNTSHISHARDLAAKADVLIEQFRPGVMERLGLGAVTLHAINPRLIYVSITGFGQTGPRAALAGHDLNYQALNGVLAQGLARCEAAPLPPALIADIAGGAYPAMMNILLALRQRDQTGLGCHLDIAMADNAATFAWLTAAAAAAKSPVDDAGALLTGGSPRYRIYPTSDGWFVAVGALEDKFWGVFCEAVNLPRALRSPDASAHDAIEVVGNILASRSASDWRTLLEPLDCCCTVVRTFTEAEADARQAGTRFSVMARDQSGASVPVASIPIDRQFRVSADVVRPVSPLMSGMD